MHTNLRSVASAFASCALLFFMLLAPNEAHARGYDRDGRSNHFLFSFDFDYSAAISNRILNAGAGGAMRIGHQIDFYLMTLIPELQLEYHSFGSEFLGKTSLFAGKVGSRVRFLSAVEPGVFAHIGVGNLSGRTMYSHGGTVLDVGTSLDFTFLPMVDFGIHVAWNRIFGGYESGVSYTVSGFHFALVF